MNEDRREEIIMATLELSSQIGLGAVSMSMIAKKIGIKKPSLYNHFASKEELIGAMYEHLRNLAKRNANIGNWGDVPSGVSANELLKASVSNYIKMNQDPNILMFYKLIYSERAISKDAANIMLEETQKMINATKRLFEILQNKNLLHLNNIDVSATAFALTVHAFMDYEMDKSFCSGNSSIDCTMLNQYIDDFCRQNKVGD